MYVGRVNAGREDYVKPVEGQEELVSQVAVVWRQRDTLKVVMVSVSSYRLRGAMLRRRSLDLEDGGGFAAIHPPRMSRLDVVG